MRGNTVHKNFFMRRSYRLPAGLTLLELVIATSMMAVVATSLTLVLRTAREAWDVGDSDYAVVHHAECLARHFVRNCREAKSVESISTGQVTLEMQGGEKIQWELVGSHSGMTGVVLTTYANSGDVVPLARQIQGLSFAGFKADATTPSTAVDDIQLIQVQVDVVLPTNGVRRTITADAWLRSW